MRKASTRRARREQGFTLLEVLVGLAISALLLVAASLAMKTIDMSYGRTSAALARQSRAETGLEIFVGDVARIERAFDDPAKPQRFLFMGGPDAMIYVLAERPGANAGGIYWVRLQVRRGPAGDDLVRARAPMRLGESDPRAVAWADPVTLLHGGDRIALSYRSTRAGLRDWAAEWNAPDMLPDQIKIELTDIATGRLRLPVLVATLRRDAEANCGNPGNAGCTLGTSGGAITAATAGPARAASPPAEPMP